MALPTLPAVVESNSDITDATTYTTASFTPKPGHTYLVSVAVTGTAIGTVSLSGNGITWTNEISQLHGTVRRNTLLYGVANGASTTGAITITCTTTSLRCYWIISEVSGTRTSDPIEASSSTSGGPTTSGSIALAAFSHAANASFGAIYCSSNTGENVVPGTGFTEIEESASSEPGTLENEWQLADDDPDWTFTSSNWAAIGAQIAVGFPARNRVINQAVKRAAYW